MQIQLLSDLHLEHFSQYKLNGLALLMPLIADTADVIVLCGDIDVGLSAIQAAEAIARETRKPVMFVPGNHEFYGSDYPALRRAFDTYVSAQKAGVHVLQNRHVIIDGVRFLGGTLWTDFNLYKNASRMPTAAAAMAVGNRALADFRYIKNNGVTFKAETSREVHLATRKYFKETLNTPHPGPTVVMSHHAPHAKSIDIKFSPGERVLNSPMRLPNENPYWQVNPCFASDLTLLLAKADVWLHGHVHDSFEYVEQDCRVYANPRGYPRLDYNGELFFENANFTPQKLITV